MKNYSQNSDPDDQLKIDDETLKKIKSLGFKDLDFNIYDQATLNDEEIQTLDKYFLAKDKSIEFSSIDFYFEDFNKEDSTAPSDNKINKEREDILDSKYTPLLINLIYEEDFEFGYISRSQVLIEEQFQVNKLATRNWLNKIFIEHFKDEKIVIGLLRIIGRFDEDTIFPQGQTMAMSALIHKNDEIKELGIRAFENWCSLKSYEVLKTIEISSDWLKEYLDDVISNLEEDLCLY